MLRIRKEQVAELGKVSIRNFEETMFKRVQKYFPHHYRVAGEPAVREVIQLGIERAYSYGFKSKRNVGLYIIVMFMLGSYFDEDVIHQNLAGKLQGEHKSIMRANACMDDIVDAAKDFISNCLGPEDSHINRALLTLKAEPKRLFCSLSGSDSGRKIRAHFEQLFPAKTHFLSGEKQRALISLGQKKAKSYDFRSDRAQSLFLSLMFITHSFFDLDPLFPLFKEVLNNPVIKQEEDMTEKLYDAALRTIEKWLERP